VLPRRARPIEPSDSPLAHIAVGMPALLVRQWLGEAMKSVAVAAKQR